MKSWLVRYGIQFESYTRDVLVEAEDKTQAEIAAAKKVLREPWVKHIKSVVVRQPDGSPL